MVERNARVLFALLRSQIASEAISGTEFSEPSGGVASFGGASDLPSGGAAIGGESVSGVELMRDELAAESVLKILPELLKLAGAHDLLPILAEALLKGGYVSPDSKGAQGEIAKAIYRTEQLAFELSSVSALFEMAEIQHIPLKGAVLREYYPKPYFRTSGDLDVLVKKKDFERARALLAEKLGYTQKARSTHDVSLFTPSGQVVELHFDLVEDWRGGGSVGKILSSVWENTTVHEGCKYRLDMTDTFFYFYHIAHMAKHFEVGGCGARSVVDLYVLDGVRDADFAARDRLLAEGGLLKFAGGMRALARAWFSGEPTDPITESISDYILRGGIYGSYANRVEAAKRENDGRFSYILSRIFAPREKLARYYPILNKRPWLLPVMQVRRWLMLLNPTVAKMAKNELAQNAIKNGAGEELKNMFTALGL